MAVVQNIIGMVRDINDRRREARVEDAIRANWLTSPDVAIAEAIKADPKRGLALQDAQMERTTAADAARRKRTKENTDTLARYLRGAPQGSDYGAILDAQAPFFARQGITSEEVSDFKSAITANPNILSGLDDTAYEAMAKDRFSDTIATPGAYVRRGGETVERVPYAPKAVVVKGGDGSSQMQLFDPNEYLPGPSAAPRAAPGPAPAGDSAADLEEQATGITGRVIMGNRANPKGVQTVTQSEARLMQNAFGGGAPGKERFEGWAKQYGVRVVPDGQGPAGLPVERVQTAPTMRAQRSGQPIGAPSAPKPQKSARPASQEELRAAGYPEGTAAQINENGQFVNLRTPPASKQKSAAQEYKEMKDADALIAKAKNVDDSFGMLENYASRLISSPGMEGATGSIEGRLPGWALGQEAQDFMNQLETLKSNIGLSVLTNFKSQSSQGASGFGNLSNAEGERLERAFGTLERTSSPKVIKESLRTIIDIARKKRAEARAAVQRGGQPQRQQGRQAPQLGTRIRDKATGRTAILDNSGWVWEDTGQPVGGRKKK